MLKDFASQAAARLQNRFRWAALIIVGLHVLATALALLAMKTDGKNALRGLLGVECFALIAGLLYHHWLHHSGAARQWAMARLAAEVARSAEAMSAIRCSLRHLAELPMPHELRPLLRTLDVLQLAGVRRQTGTWVEAGQSYLARRLGNPRGGQLDYYERKLVRARFLYRVARTAFHIGSFGALMATGAKLALVLGWWRPQHVESEAIVAVAGFLAVLLPVVAVAALSLAAAFDLEARVHTYRDMLVFLKEQARLLKAVADPERPASESEFTNLALQTESRLLGETAHWHERRAFTGVA